MPSFKNLQLSVRLPLAFAVAMLAMLASAMYGVHTLDSAIDEIGSSVQADQRSAAAAAEVLVLFKTQVQEWKNTLLRGKDAKALERHWGAFAKLEQAIAGKAKGLAQALPPGEHRDLAEKFAAAHTTMGAHYRQAHANFVASGMDAVLGDKAVSGLDREPAKLLDHLAESLNARAAQHAHAAAEQAERARRISIALMLLTATASVVAGWWFSRAIVKPIKEAAAMARAVAAGDLTVQAGTQGNDETAQLLAALCDMQASLSRVVSEVRANAENVSNASTQIAEGNADLSQRTERQAGSLQHAAATMEQLGSTARNNTDSARQANQLAQSASTIARRGGEVVGQVVDTMRGISDSSRRIAEIIGTIDGIAFQTNILALNAAVEAARAGEQGRGFAVVASEVRVLAQRSAEAARQIKSLIAASVERVEQGAQLVDHAGKTMHEVVSSIGRVSDIVGEITSASVEQSSGVQQVGGAVSEMDQTTQRNAALVQQSAAAAEGLRHQAQQLVRAVGVFKLARGR